MLILVSGGPAAWSISDTEGKCDTAVSCWSHILDRFDEGDGTPEVGAVDCSLEGDALLLGGEEGTELSLAPSTCLNKLCGAGETERRMLGLGRRFARRITVGWPKAREILCEKRFANFGVGWLSCSVTCPTRLTGKECVSGRGSDRASTPSTDG